MLHYVNYARRSSDETSNRQIQSIDDQLKETRRLAQEFGLTVVEELTESMSAKAPGRPVFNQVIQMIERGQANAILCWKLDRLSRNPVDAGTLRWLLQNSIIKEIRTPYQVYRPEDNALITAVENAMSEQYVIDLKKNVERGMISKCEKGGFPHMAPVGYLNDRLNKTIVVDPERFSLLRRAWELLLKGSHSVPEIHDILINRWGYRHRITARTPDGKLTLSGLYKIFSNPFYMGVFRFKGQTYVHCFPRMVTKEEFEQAQAWLHRRSHKHRWKEGSSYPRHTFAFTGLLACVTCGRWATAEISKGHTYYHCNNRKGVCTKKGIREESLAAQIDALLESISFYPEFETLALKVLAILREEQHDSQQQITASQEKARAALKRQKDALLSLYLQGHLDAEEYARKKQELSAEEATLRLEAEQAEQGHDSTLTTMENVVHYLTHARSLFMSESPLRQRLVARHLGHYFFNNGELDIELNKLFVPVRSEFKKLKNPFLKIEPLQMAHSNLLQTVPAPIFQQWWATFKEYQTFILKHNLSMPRIDAPEK
ncbi:MAG: recombinase family protein [Thermoproteota archaeon]|nr:recombinase family protein [Thermoproteota archaeon]